MQVRPSINQRLQKLPPYLFAELDRRKKALLARGIDLISLGVGDPDTPTPPHIINAAKAAMDNPKHHQYPFGGGLSEFRTAVSNFMKGRFNVDVSPDSEIYALIGSKEGIGHLPLGVIDSNDIVLVPDPGYPVYQGSTILAGGEVYYMPLLERNGFIPDLDAIPAHILERASLMFIGYPNNPTSAMAPMEFFEKAAWFGKKYSIVVAHDNAYSEIYYDQAPRSFLEVSGAKEVGVEFHSLSKTYNMTGWRLGWVCGNKEVVKKLSVIKDNYDSGAFEVVQKAGIAALSGPQQCVEEIRKIYKARRDIFVPGLKHLGWDVNTPSATFYVWAKTPKGLSSLETVNHMLDHAHVLCTPGNGFGPAGEGFVRFTLTVDVPVLKDALQRIAKLKW